MGASLQAVCAASIYQNSGLDSFFDDSMKEARCLMLRELGYLTNHKCARASGGYACATPGAEGFSYMVGCVHSPDPAMRIR